MPRIKQFKEEEVLEKAIEVFWKKGYYATSMQDLVDEMGINRASLYDTFGSKEALFEKAFKRYREINQKKIRDFLYAQSSIRQGIFLMYEKAIDQAIADPDRKGCFVVNTTTEIPAGDESINPLLMANKKDFQQLFQDYLQLGVVRGEINPQKDLPSIATLLYTLYSGIMVLSKLRPNKQELLAAAQAGLAVLD